MCHKGAGQRHSSSKNVRAGKEEGWKGERGRRELAQVSGCCAGASFRSSLLRQDGGWMWSNEPIALPEGTGGTMRVAGQRATSRSLPPVPKCDLTPVHAHAHGDAVLQSILPELDGPTGRGKLSRRPVGAWVRG